jgi:polysaccharide biosynthesis/export protein
MAFTVRGVTDWRGAKLVFMMPLLVCLGMRASYGQQKEVTSQQTNEKIKQLASLAGAKPVDTAIGTGDMLHVDVFDVQELSRDIRVSDTGDISFPLIPGKIQAAGQTTFQLEATLERLLVENGLVSHPQVSVFLKEQNSQPISVVGAVSHAMIYQVIRPTTLLEVLTAAGGITDDAASEVIITRAPRAGATKAESANATDYPAKNDQTITIRLQDLLESGDPVFNIPVYGGDVITVPHAGIVYVMGSGVAQQGGYVMQSHGEQITVLKALALAHGLTGFAKADSAVIMRLNPITGQKDAIPVHIRQIENRKMEDVALQSNDILYVPDSVGLKVLARGSEAAVGIGTQVAIYRSVY